MSSDAFTTRPRLEPPSSVEYDVGNSISILHPGYPDHENCLFTFSACDHRDGGLHKNIPLTACAIVAGNTWLGYLSAERDGPPLPATIQVLRAKFYYYYPYPFSPPATAPTAAPSPLLFAGNDPTRKPYPVYTEFRDWPFPQDLPSWWPKIPRSNRPNRSHSHSTLSHAVRERDYCCRLTGWTQITEGAHIIPKEEADWLSRNNMHMYSADTHMPTANNSANIFLLRRDVHRSYDQSFWTIVPKAMGPESEEMDWVCHLLVRDDEYAQAFHNVVLHDLHGVRAEYLLAGFALAIFPMLGPFLSKGTDRYLMGKSIVADSAGTLVSGKDCSRRFPSNKNRSRSPKKRRVSDDENDDADDKENQEFSHRGRQNSKHLSGTDPLRPLKRPRTLSIEQKHELTTVQGSKNEQISTMDSGPSCQCFSPAWVGDTTSSTLVGTNKTEVDVETVGDICRSGQCRTWKDLTRLETLRQQALAGERSRSRVNAWWQRQVDWASAKEHDAFYLRDREQFMWVRGAEVWDQKTGDWLESTPDFLDLIGPWRTDHDDN
ncbi:MAG: hypothetical protein Q9220_007602 [cf. Caloplaca sp. 1 TL-2023]